MVELYPEFFNDVFGPIMQPGSSSHTAGPCRLGFMAHSLLGEQPRKVKVILDPGGSFAGAFGIMKEDLGMLAGALGMLPDDVRLWDAPEIAAQQEVEYSFEFDGMKESGHTNAMKFMLSGVSGKTVSLVGDSTGGGMIETQVVNGFPLRVKGDTHVVLIFDGQRRVTRIEQDRITGSLHDLVERGTVESAELGALHYFKVAEAPELDPIRELVPGIQVEMIKPVLPVVTRPEKKKQLFSTMTEWREIAEKTGSSLSEVAVQYEMDASGWSRDRIIDGMKTIARKMHRVSHASFEEQVPEFDNPYAGRHDQQWIAYQKKGRVLCGGVMAEAVKMTWAALVCLPGVERVPGPMGTGGGFIYAALRAVQQSQGFSDDGLLRGLFVAAGVGAIAYTHTYPTGEIIGCTGECGICCCMATAAVTEMAGGTPAQVENAASIALQAFVGIPCDPVPGGYDQPCSGREITATCMAIVFADLALSGKDAVLPFHEALAAADTVGRGLPPELRCTSRGGCSATPSGKRQKEEYFHWFHKKNTGDRT